MSSKKPTRLELHRLRYHYSGGKIPSLPIEDLTVRERAIISRHFLSLVRDADHFYEAYAETLAHWGIVCPHPPHMRRFPQDGSERWFACELCSCNVLNDSRSIPKRKYRVSR